MNIENNTSEPTAEIKAENETQQTEEIQTTEGVGGANTNGDGDKQEESVYARELREAQEELAKQKEITDKKEATIQALKKDKKTASDPDLEERILARVRGENAQKELTQKVSVLTRDPDEQKLILHHFNATIVKTGDVDRDLQNAMAIANANVVWEQKRNIAIEERREDFLTSFPANSARGNQPMQTTDPMQRQVEQLVAKMNPDAVKHVKSQFGK